jgi:hypothetical protein
MKDMNMLFVVVLAAAALAAIWWFGWFGPVTNMFLEIKRNTVQR